jgi:hypothetical protein
VRSIVDSVRAKRHSLICQQTHPSSSVIAFYITPHSVDWVDDASDGQNTSKVKRKTQPNKYRTKHIIIEAEGNRYFGVVDISKFISILTNPPPHRSSQLPLGTPIASLPLNLLPLNLLP